MTVRVDQRTMHDERAAWDPIIGRLIAYVREERTRRRLSLRGAADESGIPFATLARIEHGRAPDLLTFRRLVLWLRIPADRLLGTERRSRAGT